MAHITFFKRIEFWIREGSWRRPSEWVFSIDRNCPNGCLIVELGFWGITINWQKESCLSYFDEDEK